MGKRFVDRLTGVAGPAAKQENRTEEVEKL
jgi:hypothetical protein